MGLSSFKFVHWAPKDTSFLHQSAFWPLKVIQGHPRSIILVPIESAYTISDRQSDGQTVGQTESIVANTALCIASYADAL